MFFHILSLSFTGNNGLEGPTSSNHLTMQPLDNSAQNPNGPISLPLGITIGLVASIIQSLGLTMQRKSHVLNEMKPEGQQVVEHRRPSVRVLLNHGTMPLLTHFGPFIFHSLWVLGFRKPMHYAYL